MSRSRKRGAQAPRPEPRRYDVQLALAAGRGLSKLPKGDAQKIVAQLRGLVDDPRPTGAIKLEGVCDLYRIRSGDYRIVYQIEDARLVVLVVNIGNRRDVYRQL